VLVLAVGENLVEGCSSCSFQIRLSLMHSAPLRPLLPETLLEDLMVYVGGIEISSSESERGMVSEVLRIHTPTVDGRPALLHEDTPHMGKAIFGKNF
jgi:hypothetical protein